jgi:hypothetical protein
MIIKRACPDLGRLFGTAYIVPSNLKFDPQNLQQEED